MDNLKDPKIGEPDGCLNYGHPYSRQRIEVGTVFYCKNCEKYEKIVHVSEAGINTSQSLEKEELFQLLSEEKLTEIDSDDIKDKKFG